MKIKSNMFDIFNRIKVKSKIFITILIFNKCIIQISHDIIIEVSNIIYLIFICYIYNKL